MLSLENVAKQYGSLQAVHPLSLTIERGRTTVLIGPSGCGKSTLIRLMNGLIRPDHGRVTCDGTLVAPENLLALRRRIGYVIQEGGLFPHLTARSNVTLLARHVGWQGPKITSRVAELAELVHLDSDRLDQYPVQLSGGQRQRVSLMRALMLDPDVLLLDEPLGALDPMIRSYLQSDLRNIFQSLHKTVVLVTHDLNEAAFLGDHIVLLRSGEVVQQGSIDDLCDRPVDPFVREFINAQRSTLSNEVRE